MAKPSTHMRRAFVEACRAIDAIDETPHYPSGDIYKHELEKLTEQLKSLYEYMYNSEKN